MKTTIVMAVLGLVLATPVYAQDNDEARPGRPGREPQLRGPGGPQFRGGDLPPGAGGRYGRPGGWRGSEDGDRVGPGRRDGQCPNCGAPLRARQGRGFGGPGQGFGPGPQGGGRGVGPGPRFDDLDRPPGPPESEWGRGARRGPGPQDGPGFGPRGRGAGGPPWDREDEEPRERE